MPRVDRADEVLVSELLAGRHDVAVGDRLDLVLLSATRDDDEEGMDRAPAEAGVPLTATVTGIGTSYDEVIPFSQQNEEGHIFATPALRRDDGARGLELRGRVPRPGARRRSRSADGGDRSAGAGEHAEATGGELFISDEVAQTETVVDALATHRRGAGRVGGRGRGRRADRGGPGDRPVEPVVTLRGRRAAGGRAATARPGGLRPRPGVGRRRARRRGGGRRRAGAVVAVPDGCGAAGGTVTGAPGRFAVLAVGALVLALVATLAALPGAVTAARRPRRRVEPAAGDGDGGRRPASRGGPGHTVRAVRPGRPTPAGAQHAAGRCRRDRRGAGGGHVRGEPHGAGRHPGALRRRLGSARRRRVRSDPRATDPRRARRPSGGGGHRGRRLRRRGGGGAHGAGDQPHQPGRRGVGDPRRGRATARRGRDRAGRRGDGRARPDGGRRGVDRRRRRGAHDGGHRPRGVPAHGARLLRHDRARRGGAGERGGAARRAVLRARGPAARVQPRRPPLHVRRHRRGRGPVGDRRDARRPRRGRRRAGRVRRRARRASSPPR